jgi:hypothetical protein
VTNPSGEGKDGVLRLDFDRRVTVQFRGSLVSSDAGLLAYRELDDALGLSSTAVEVLADARTGKNGRHTLVGLLRQSVFGRLAGYEDVNDAEGLRHDPTIRWVVGGRAAIGRAASPSQMGRFETHWLAAPGNLRALVDLSGFWIDRVGGRRSNQEIVLDMDSSVSPTHGEQEKSVWNGHFGCTCYHPLFVFIRIRRAPVSSAKRRWRPDETTDGIGPREPAESATDGRNATGTTHRILPRQPLMRLKHQR